MLFKVWDLASFIQYALQLLETKLLVQMRQKKKK